MTVDILEIESTHFTTYRDMNPDLNVHHMYQQAGDTADMVPEGYHFATTRIGLSSNKLGIETGRCSRVPQELRVCVPVGR